MKAIGLGWTKVSLIATMAPTKANAKIAVAPASRPGPVGPQSVLNGDTQPLITRTFLLTQAESIDLYAARAMTGAEMSSGRFENNKAGLMAVARSSGGKPDLTVAAWPPLA